MRIRTIKPEFWRSPAISGLPVFERLLFIGLWSYCDDNGVGWEHVPAIAADLFADDLASNPRECLASVSRGLQTLFRKGLLVRFEADGRQLLAVTNWGEHQRIDRPSKGHGYPLPPAETVEKARRLASVSRGLQQSAENYPLGTGEQGNRGTGDKQYCSPGADTSPIPGLETPHEPADAGGALACAEHNPPTPKPKPEPYPAAFEEFWAAYPRKVGKRKALPAWQKAVRRAGPETVLAGAKRLANDPNLPEQQFVPHPATWLNRDSWDDPPLPNPHARSGQQKRVFGTRPEDWLSGGDGGGVVEGEVVTADESTTWANSGHDQVFQDYLAQIGGRS